MYVAHKTTQPVIYKSEGEFVMNMFIQIVEPVQETNRMRKEQLVCSFFSVRERDRREELVSGK